MSDRPKRFFHRGFLVLTGALLIASAGVAVHAAEAVTLEPVINDVLAHYPVKRVVLVADRGLLSLDNLAQLQRITTDGKPDGAVDAFINALEMEGKEMPNPATSSLRSRMKQIYFGSTREKY